MKTNILIVLVIVSTLITCFFMGLSTSYIVREQKKHDVVYSNKERTLTDGTHTRFKHIEGTDVTIMYLNDSLHGVWIDEVFLIPDETQEDWY